LSDVQVRYENDSSEIELETVTNGSGYYEFTNLPPGNAEIQVSAHETDRAFTGSDVDLAGDLTGFDFDLVPQACVSGRVVDETNQGVSGASVGYWSELHNAWSGSITDGNGYFTICNLPPGVGELDTFPGTYSGFCESANRVMYLNEGESRDVGLVRLQRCAFVQGTVTTADFSPLCGDLEVESDGFDFEADSNVEDGTYQFRLPVGTHRIYFETQGGGPYPLAALPAMVKVTEDAVRNWWTVTADTMTVYDQTTGHSVNVQVNGSAAYTGSLMVAALPAGLLDSITPESMAEIGSVNELRLQGLGSSGDLGPLPPSTYDILLFLDNESDNGFTSITAIGSHSDQVVPGTTNLEFIYGSEGSQVEGHIDDHNGDPVLGSQVLVTNESGNFAAFAITDETGRYSIPNLPAGNYTVQARHLLYSGSPSTGLTTTDGVPATVDPLTLTPTAISGTVTYSYEAGGGKRKLIIWGSMDPAFSYHEPLFSEPVASGDNQSFNYDLSIPTPGRHFLYYFIDLDDNGTPDLGEPFAYQGYNNTGGFNEQIALNLEAETPGMIIDNVDVTLQPATLDPDYASVFHRRRASDPDNFLVASYSPHAPFALIDSLVVTGPGLLAPVDIREVAGTDGWYEYWYQIPETSFVGGIPNGANTYTVRADSNGDWWEQSYTINTLSGQHPRSFGMACPAPLGTGWTSTMKTVTGSTITGWTIPPQTIPCLMG
jgi:hypothetical protein